MDICWWYTASVCNAQRQSQIKLYFGRRKIECTLIRPDKCKELRISFARNLEEFHVGFVQGKEPEVVSSTKLLGLTISDNLKWNVNDLIKKKASKRNILFISTKTGTIAASGFSSIFIQRVYDLQLTSAVPVFCNTLPQYLINELVHIEKRALSIVMPGLSYGQFLDITPVVDQNRQVCGTFFNTITSDKNHNQSSTFCRLATILGIVWETIAPITFHVILPTERNCFYACSGRI